MMSRHPIAFALLALLTALPAARAEEDQTVPCASAQYETATPVAWGGPEPVYDGFALPDDAPAGREDFESELAELLQDEARAVGGEVTPVEGGLLVEGAEAQALLRRRVAAIDGFVQGRGVFRVAVVHVPDEGDAADAASVRAAVSEGRASVIWSSRLTALRGEPVVREEIDHTTFVAFIDAEVAQYASIADPQTAMLGTGVRVGLWQRPLDGDRTRAFLSFQLSRLEETEHVTVASGVLDLPRVSFVTLGAPLLLERGAPRLLVVDHPWEPGMVAVMVEALELPATPELPYDLVDTAAVVGVDVLPPFVPLGMDDGSRWDEDEPGDPFEAAEELVEALVDAHDSLVQLTPYIVAIPGDRAPRSAGPGVTLHRRIWAVRSSELGGVPGYDALDGTVDRERGLADVSVGVPHVSVRVPVRSGTRSWWASGTWTRVPADVEVEIAEGAIATVPVVHSFVEGDAFTARLVREGAVHVAWESVVVLDRKTHPLVVRKDVSGKRAEDQDDVHIAVRHRRSRGTQVVTGAEPLGVRRLPVTSEIGLWDVE